MEDGERLKRAIRREEQQTVPKYEEMCRRFLADAEDFSEEKLAQAGIGRRFANKELEQCIKEITGIDFNEIETDEEAVRLAKERGIEIPDATKETNKTKTAKIIENTKTIRENYIAKLSNQEKEGRPVRMCNIAQALEEKGIEKGIEKSKYNSYKYNNISKFNNFNIYT